jgi:tetratricopeptide (TPR) repeat protein
MKLEQYKRALKYYKQILELSWEVEDKKHEIVAYHKIGLAYYELGELDKSAFYM